MATRREIVDGPSKFDLMVAFFNRQQGHDNSLVFCLGGPDFGDGPSGVCWVTGLKQEWNDPSGRWTPEGWLFEGIGFCRPSQTKHPVFGAYNTKTRKGWIKQRKELGGGH